MGYTHYYTQNRDLTGAEWAQLTAAFTHMLNHLPATSTSAGGYYANFPLVIRDGYGKGQPEVNGRYLCFNGDDTTADDLAHEGFYLSRQKEEESFNFCKTARKPYDLLVCAVLLAVSEIAPGAFDVASDGDMTGEDWQPARDFLAALPPLTQQTALPITTPTWETLPC